eukprot:10880259-Alexandrium_andersonii.AAC.1
MCADAWDVTAANTIDLKRMRSALASQPVCKAIRAHGHDGTEANKKLTCMSTCVWAANLCEATMGTMCDARMYARTMLCGGM